MEQPHSLVNWNHLSEVPATVRSSSESTFLNRRPPHNIKMECCRNCQNCWSADCLVWTQCSLPRCSLGECVKKGQPFSLHLNLFQHPFLWIFRVFLSGGHGTTEDLRNASLLAEPLLQLGISRFLLFLLFLFNSYGWAFCDISAKTNFRKTEMFWTNLSFQGIYTFDCLLV